MASKRKLPKAPKQSASLDVWKRYEGRLKEVQKHNDQVDRDKSAKKSLIARVLKARKK